MDSDVVPHVSVTVEIFIDDRQHSCCRPFV